MEKNKAYESLKNSELLKVKNKKNGITPTNRYRQCDWKNQSNVHEIISCLQLINVENTYQKMAKIIVMKW